MLKNLSQLETMVEGKIHRYLCDHDSQIDHVIQALVQFLSYAQKFKDAAVVQTAPQASPTPVSEEQPKQETSQNG